MQCSHGTPAVNHSRWIVVLAGDQSPLQSSSGGENPLQITMRSVAGLVPPRRTKLVLTRPHTTASADRAKSPGWQTIVQPAKRGTAPAILYALLSIDAEDPGASVAVLPWQHNYSDEAVFSKNVDLAFRLVDRKPQLVTLLGIEPDSAATDLGWIQPGEPLDTSDGLRRVVRFEEKPPLAEAKRLRAAGSLWNSFVLVGGVQTLLHLFANTLPDLYNSFERLESEIGTDAESRAAEMAYRLIPSVDFSRSILAANPTALSVLPMAAIGWNDTVRARRIPRAHTALKLRPEIDVGTPRASTA